MKTSLKNAPQQTVLRGVADQDPADPDDAAREALSALADGELVAEDARHLLRGLRDRPEMMSDWDMHHLIGDAMRGEYRHGSSIAQAVNARLRSEPTVLAPGRWRQAAGVAVLAGALVVGVLVVGRDDNPSAPLLAHGPDAGQGSASLARPYVAAHRDFTPAVFSADAETGNPTEP